MTVMPLGTRWPSGRYTSVAVLPMDACRLAEAIGCPLNTGAEEGLGTWVGAGIALPSGQLVEFVQYAHAPRASRFRGARRRRGQLR
jgi:hypothetical protein